MDVNGHDPQFPLEMYVAQDVREDLPLSENILTGMYHWLWSRLFKRYSETWKGTFVRGNFYFTGILLWNYGLFVELNRVTSWAGNSVLRHFAVKL